MRLVFVCVCSFCRIAASLMSHSIQTVRWCKGFVLCGPANKCKRRRDCSAQNHMRLGATRQVSESLGGASGQGSECLFVTNWCRGREVAGSYGDHHGAFARACQGQEFATLPGMLNGCHGACSARSDQLGRVVWVDTDQHSQRAVFARGCRGFLDLCLRLCLWLCRLSVAAAVGGALAGLHLVRNKRLERCSADILEVGHGE